MRVGSFRQLNSGLLHQGTVRELFPITLYPDKRHSPVVFREQDRSQSQAHSRSPEPPPGLSVEGGGATLTEWSLDPIVTMECIRLWGPPTVDLFATRLNRKLPLYVSGAGHAGNSSGRPESIRERDGCVRIPSFQSHSGDPKQSGEVELSNHFSSAVVASESLVQPVVIPTDGEPEGFSQ